MLCTECNTLWQTTSADVRTSGDTNMSNALVTRKTTISP